MINLTDDTLTILQKKDKYMQELFIEKEYWKQRYESSQQQIKYMAKYLPKDIRIPEDF
ncbi:hypothetical protein NSA47_05865 [Irregularibacter muris]|uniref:Uncharacterized protein n=1 Tax=Irregularibacter muris TaxID=1796619 RepID=A0AAE3KZM8_9FIRM|nr:hypothetical protein [Irregularibacter muris]MCR1898517.1 hypothetical protein [Irregularibacter muris]